MTSRTKRRLAVLALALGLIAAAPYAFHWVTDRNIDSTSELVWFVAARSGLGDGTERVLLLQIWSLELSFHSFATCQFGWRYLSLGIGGRFDLPHESITLRVACAVALLGVWLLVVGGRRLARKLTRTNAASVVA